MAAEASRCAAEQGQFWKYHDLLFESSGKLPKESLIEKAKQLELQERQFDSCIDSGKYRSQVEEDIKYGISAGVSGTPGFFINGVFLAGAQPTTAFEKIISEELESKTQR